MAAKSDPLDKELDEGADVPSTGTAEKAPRKSQGKTVRERGGTQGPRPERPQFAGVDVPTPSELQHTIDRHEKASGIKAGTTDPFRFRQEHGIPSPVRLYSVEVTAKDVVHGPLIIWETDPVAATAAALKKYRIEKVHRSVVRVGVIEE